MGSARMRLTIERVMASMAWRVSGVDVLEFGEGSLEFGGSDSFGGFADVAE